MKKYINHTKTLSRKNQLLFPFNLIVLICWVNTVSAQQFWSSVNPKIDTIENPIEGEIMRTWINYVKAEAAANEPKSYWLNGIHNPMDRETFEGQLKFCAYPISIKEKAGKKYIDVAYIVDSLNSLEIRSMLIAMQQIEVSKENGKWMFHSPLVEHPEREVITSKGFIKYHHPKDVLISDIASSKMIDFCEYVAETFGFPIPRHVDYFIFHDVYEVQRELGLTYYYGPLKSGYHYDKIVLDANSNPFNAHQLTYALLPENVQRHTKLAEGFATWISGSQDIEAYKKLIGKAAKQHFAKKQSLAEILDSRNTYQLAPVTATIFAVLQKLKGEAGVKALLNADTNTNMAMIQAIEKSSGLKFKSFEIKWQQEFSKYTKY